MPAHLSHEIMKGPITRWDRLGVKPEYSGQDLIWQAIYGDAVVLLVLDHADDGGELALQSLSGSFWGLPGGTRRQHKDEEMDCTAISDSRARATLRRHKKLNRSLTLRQLSCQRPVVAQVQARAN